MRCEGILHLSKVQIAIQYQLNYTLTMTFLSRNGYFNNVRFFFCAGRRTNFTFSSRKCSVASWLEGDTCWLWCPSSSSDGRKFYQLCLISIALIDMNDYLLDFEEMYVVHVFTLCFFFYIFWQVFVDNFVHGDLHPGNILVQNAENYIPQV